METCQPYACSLVAVFGFLAGVAALGAALMVAQVVWNLREWWRRRRTEKLLQVVDEAFPTWRNVVTTARYNEWLRTQPSETRSLASSMKPQDAIEVLRRFEARS